MGKVFNLLKQTFTEFGEDRCSRIAASMAYSTAFALAPMLMLIIGLGQFFFEPEDITGKIETNLEEVVGESGADQIRTIIEGSQKKEQQGVWATVLSVGIVLLGATGLFAQLQVAMNDVWDIKPDPDASGIWYFISKRLLSLGMVLSTAFLVIVSLAVTGIISSFDDVLDNWLPGSAGSMIFAAGNFLLSLLVLTGLFAAMFKVLPDAKVRWKDVAVGAAVTALLFMLGKFGLGWYLGSKNMATTYGAAGSLVLILAWVYYSTLIFMFGAEFTQVWAKLYGDGIQPSKIAVRISGDDE